MGHIEFEGKSYQLISIEGKVDFDGKPYQEYTLFRLEDGEKVKMIYKKS